MISDAFRILHSKLMEQYQFIEFHLEGIYAQWSGKPVMDALKEVEKDSLNRIVKEIQDLEKEKSCIIFSDEEYREMAAVFQRRNFWCHSCYCELVFNAKTGELKREEARRQMMQDLQDAITLRDKLHQKDANLWRIMSKG